MHLVVIRLCGYLFSETRGGGGRYALNLHFQKYYSTDIRMLGGTSGAPPSIVDAATLRDRISISYCNSRYRKYCRLYVAEEASGRDLKFQVNSYDCPLPLRPALRNILRENSGAYACRQVLSLGKRYRFCAVKHERFKLREQRGIKPPCVTLLQPRNPRREQLKPMYAYLNHVKCPIDSPLSPERK